MGWTDERVERLKALWAEGLSASQIAAELGGVTRNAVIGKVHRLGLSGRAKPQAQTARPAQAPRMKSASPSISRSSHTSHGSSHTAHRPTQRPMTIGNTALKMEHMPEVVRVAQPVARIVEEMPLVFKRISIAELSESTCKWPLGDPGRPDFAFCGLSSDNGIPYCNHHARIAYQPTADRKRRVGA